MARVTGGTWVTVTLPPATLTCPWPTRLCVLGGPFLSMEKLPEERSSLILSKGIVSSPAMSLLKTTLPESARTRWPVSWSPLVKMRTSGWGLGGGVFDWARAVRARRMVRPRERVRKVRKVWPPGVGLDTWMRPAGVLVYRLGERGMGCQKMKGAPQPLWDPAGIKEFRHGR